MNLLFQTDAILLLLFFCFIVVTVDCQCQCSDDNCGNGGWRITKDRKKSTWLWLEVGDCAHDGARAGVRIRYSASSRRIQRCQPTTSCSVSASVNEVALWRDVSRQPDAHVFCIQCHYLWVVPCNTQSFQLIVERIDSDTEQWALYVSAVEPN